MSGGMGKIEFHGLSKSKWYFKFILKHSNYKNVENSVVLYIVYNSVSQLPECVPVPRLGGLLART